MLKIQCFYSPALFINPGLSSHSMTNSTQSSSAYITTMPHINCVRWLLHGDIASVAINISGLILWGDGGPLSGLICLGTPEGGTSCLEGPNMLLYEIKDQTWRGKHTFILDPRVKNRKGRNKPKFQTSPNNNFCADPFMDARNKGGEQRVKTSWIH